MPLDTVADPDRPALPEASPSPCHPGPLQPAPRPAWSWSRTRALWLLDLRQFLKDFGSVVMSVLMLIAMGAAASYGSDVTAWATRMAKMYTDAMNVDRPPLTILVAGLERAPGLERHLAAEELTVLPASPDCASPEGPAPASAYPATACAQPEDAAERQAALERRVRADEAMAAIAITADRTAPVGYRIRLLSREQAYPDGLDMAQQRRAMDLLSVRMSAERAIQRLVAEETNRVFDERGVDRALQHPVPVDKVTLAEAEPKGEPGPRAPSISKVSALSSPADPNQGLRNQAAIFQTLADTVSKLPGFMVPRMVLFILSGAVLMNLMRTILMDRQKNILEPLLSTPVTGADFVVAKLLAIGTTATAGTTIYALSAIVSGLLLSGTVQWAAVYSPVAALVTALALAALLLKVAVHLIHRPLLFAIATFAVIGGFNWLMLGTLLANVFGLTLAWAPLVGPTVGMGSLWTGESLGLAHLVGLAGTAALALLAARSAARAFVRERFISFD